MNLAIVHKPGEYPQELSSYFSPQQTICHIEQTQKRKAETIQLIIFFLLFFFLIHSERKKEGGRNGT